MSTQLKYAHDGIITDQMKSAAKYEALAEDDLRQSIAEGTVVIPFNPKHSPKNLRAIGEKTRVKINANIGTSPGNSSIENEIKKLEICHALDADAVMDLSTGKNINETRKALITASSLPLGTVPAYEIFEIGRRRDGDFASIKIDDILEVIKRQAEDGVDFMTVHSGLNIAGLERLKRQKRVLGITSRGGSLLAYWMKKNNKENPFFEHFSEILEIASAYDVTLSLGDALRPGCISDATDRAQIEELITLGELSERAREKGVQTMIEGPGHIPLGEIATNMQIAKKMCKGAPFYVLGPVVCDVAPGYDHITSAIGGSIAALNGADFLCYVTPSEHLRLPDLNDVREGIVASKIAAFSADLARGRTYALEQNSAVAAARGKLDWQEQFTKSLDPERAAKLCKRHNDDDERSPCSMCGDFCAIKLFKE